MSEQNMNNNEEEDDGSDISEIIRQASSESSNIHFYNHPCLIEIERDSTGHHHSAKRRFGLSEVDQIVRDETVFNHYRSENSNLTKALQPHAALFSGDFAESSVSEFCISLEQVCAKASIRGQTVIPIYIDSYGGDVYSMLKVLDTMHSLRISYKVKFATIAQGKAMSAAALMLMFGDIGYRYATPRSTIMIHDISTIIGGRMSELQTSYRETERLSSEVMASLSSYVTKGKDSEYLQNLLVNTKHTDLYMSPTDAKEAKIIDYIGLPKFVFKLSLEERVVPVEQENWVSFYNK